MTEAKIVEGTRILVIDDEEIIHTSLSKILSREGWRVEAAYSARDGLARLELERFDLVITDLMMPRMDGLHFLRALAKCTSVPVLMITGYPTIRTAIQAMRLGAVDYVAKPFTRKELLGPVRRALQPESAENAPVGGPAGTDALLLGSVYFLPHHAWARVEQNGSFLIGAEESFLRATGKVSTISAPGELVEQGHIGLWTTTEKGEEHGLIMPLSGRIVAVNRQLLRSPSGLHAGDWLLRIVPSRLDAELELLARRR